jgi:hypothetical protein
MMMKKMMTMRTKMTTEKNSATLTAAITNSADKIMTSTSGQMITNN